MTKARTAAAKRAAKRGRTRKIGPREPNGRPQRETVADTKETAISARMRQHGLSLAKAGERLAGYEIGRLYLRHQIDLVDVEVVDEYVETVARFMALANPQHPFPRAMDYLATIKGIGGEPHQDVINRTRKRYAEWNGALHEFCPAPARIAFHEVAFFDKPVGDRLALVKECIAALRRKFR